MSPRPLVVALLAIVSASVLAQPSENDPDEKTIQRLVRDLGSDDFRQREAATAELRRIGDLAIPQLRQGQRDADLELAVRARDLLTEIEKKGAIVTCTGHDQGVIALALLPGDARVLSASADRSIRLWDLADGKQVRRFDGHTKQVWALAAAPDGKSFASSGQDRTIRLWNVADESKGRELATLPDSVRCLLFTSDGKRLLAGAFDSNIHVIDVPTGKTLAVWTGHKDVVLCLARSPDGGKIVSGGGHDDESVCVRDAESGAVLKRLVGHREHVCAVAFADNQHCVSAGYDNIVRLWDIKTGKLVREFNGHDSGVYGLAVTRDGSRILTGAMDRTLRYWDLATAEEVRRFHQNDDGINAVAITDNGRFGVSAGNDHTVRVWSLPRVRRKAGTSPQR